MPGEPKPASRAIPIRSDQVAWRRIGDELVIVPIGQRRGDLDSVYLLDEVATEIWLHIDGERSLPDIVAALVEEFEVTPERAASDLDGLLGRLAEIGALEWGAG